MTQITSDQLLVDRPNLGYAKVNNTMPVNSDPINLVMIGDLYYLLDGHHRLLKALDRSSPLEAKLLLHHWYLAYIRDNDYGPLDDPRQITITITEVENETEILRKHY